MAITRAFQIGKYEVTNELFCTVVNFLIDLGEVTAAEGSIRLSRDRQILMLLKDADDYHQFGIVYEAPHVIPVQGRENHPVVGVTWNGALEFCKCA